MATRLKRSRGGLDGFEPIEAPPALVEARGALYLPRDAAPHRVVQGGRVLGGGGPDMSAAGLPPDPPAELPAPAGTAPEGTYVLLPGVTFHYGHFIVDTLSHLWPLAHWTGPRPRILCPDYAGRADWERHPSLRAMLEGLDLTLDDVATFDRPTVLPHVLVPERSFRSLEGVHAVFGDLCRRIGRPHWREAEVDTLAAPVYLSKTRVPAGVSRLLNEADLCEELRRLGADVAFPEAMTFAEQVRLFAARRVVMGTTGSAFHTTAFTAPGRRIIGLTGVPEVNANHGLFDAVTGSRSRYYFAYGTRFPPPEAGFELSWTVSDPRRVAEQLMARARDFDRIDALDAADEAAAARRRRSLGARLGRLGRRVFVRP